MALTTNVKVAKCRGCGEPIPAGQGVRVFCQSGWDFGVKPGYVHNDNCIVLGRSRGVFIEKAKW